MPDECSNRFADQGVDIFNSVYFDHMVNNCTNSMVLDALGDSRQHATFLKRTVQRNAMNVPLHARVARQLRNGRGMTPFALESLRFAPVLRGIAHVTMNKSTDQVDDLRVEDMQKTEQVLGDFHIPFQAVLFLPDASYDTK